MDTLILEKLHHLRDHLVAQQAYIQQLEMLLADKEIPCREVLHELKKRYAYVDHVHFEKDALAEGRF